MSDRQPVDLLIRGGTIVTVDDADRIIPDGAVAIKGMEIVGVGASQQIQVLYEGKDEIDATGKVIIPGLVNTHTHLAMTIFRGIADDMRLEPWLDKIWKLEGEFASEENCRLGTQLAFIEMIRGGTTLATDMYWHIDDTNNVAREMNFRLVNGPIFIDFVGPDGVAPEDREAVARKILANIQDDQLVHPCVLAHSTYSVPEELLKKAGEIAEEFGALFITHASESMAEVQTVTEDSGKTPIEFLDALGLLTPHTLLAHCVHLNDAEIALLAKRDTKVAHCPESNLKLGNGVARVTDLRAAGVTVGIGTDGAASNNDLDMWGEMRSASLLQKGMQHDPTALPAPQAFRMATIEGARALGLEALIGSIEVGKRADLALVDFEKTHLNPVYDLYSHLVYAVDRSDVDTVLINGKVVMRERELLTIDETAVLTEAKAVGAKIKAENQG
ncbi:MAG: amidohydrolase [Anaerolineales bacterium]|nr:amidohydrolase [Anaerolineales bacterium]